jgi:uncharacterized membrane protein
MAWSDQRIEHTIGNLLRAGVMTSALVVLVGAVLYVMQHGPAPTDYHVFRGEPSDLRTFSGILHAALALHGRGVIQLGLVLLIFTPVARVAFSIWGFLEEHDRMYVAFTCIVLAILLYSLFGAGSAF